MGSHERRMINLQYDRALEQQMQQQEWQDTANEADRQFQMEQWLREFQAQQDEWTRQFNLENEYNTPSAQVARLSAAGINPAAAFQNVQGSTGSAAVGGSSSPPSPAYPASHSVSPVGLAHVSGISSDSMMFSSLAQLGDSLSKLKQVGLNEKRQQAMLNAEVQNTVADTQQKRESAALTSTLNSIKSAFGDKQAQAEVSKLIADSYQAYSDGDYKKALSLVADTEKDLNAQKYAYNKEAYPELVTNLRKLGNLYQAKVGESQAAAAQHRAEASYFGALTQTENDLREGRVKGLDLSNDLAGIEKQLRNRENVRDAATNADQIHSIVESCRRQGLINSLTEQQIKKAVSDNDWNDVEHFIGCMSQAVGSVTSVGQLGINEWSAEQKIDVQREFNRLYGNSRPKSSVERRIVKGKNSEVYTQYNY